jgi:hypothetical protein
MKLMRDYDSVPDNLTRWQLVLKAAQELGQGIFTANDIVKKVHESQCDVPATSIRTYVIAMAPNHPSYHHYPVHHPHFEFIGNGKYRLLRQDGASPLVRQTPAQKNSVKLVDGVSESNDFLIKYRSLIVSWAKEHKNALIEGRKNYRWKVSSLSESLEKRNHLTRLIVQSRIRNNGGVDLATLDEIMAWGFPKNPEFKPRDPNKCVDITRQAFSLLDEQKPVKAICKLMSFPLIISRASKIVGLSDPNYFAIYDSRVGIALAKLKDGNERLIKIPGRAPQPGKTFTMDICSIKEWGVNYQKLIWVMEVIVNLLNEEGYPFNIADVEMGLFMMGK